MILIPKFRETLKICGTVHIDKFNEYGELVGTFDGEDDFLTSGINELWQLVIGGSANAFDNSNAEIGIGDSTTAFAASQTDLQASTNKKYVGMATGYPKKPATSGDGKCDFQASFGSSDANYAWEEWVIKQSTSGICLNRAVTSMGTKASGATWVPTMTLSIS